MKRKIDGLQLRTIDKLVLYFIPKRREVAYEALEKHMATIVGRQPFLNPLI
jgi:hypothetical protein